MSIFHRTIEIDIDVHSEGMFSLTTGLRDVYHDILLTLLISVPDYIIKDIHVDMRAIPHENCRQVYKLVRTLAGRQVGAGFTRQVLDALGGEGGCPNLINLILITAPLVINAAAVLHARQEKLTRDELDDLLQEALAGVCIGYSREKKEGE